MAMRILWLWIGYCLAGYCSGATIPLSVLCRQKPGPLKSANADTEKGLSGNSDLCPFP